ncbi:chymotrypsinogen A-like [Ruditapes philippinarum]|uniref:chymotrypsinogen A-like n=1 Tax=Ruditapes philippinarum TaxID=129788 RepID=UPI00295AB598|nr:chymotrypsinogen A-like [Ruditapes philippinarum]
MLFKCFMVVLILLQSSLLGSGSKKAFTLKPPPTKLPTHGCGIPVVQPITSRVVGGTPARPGSWPWMVLIADDLGFVTGSGVLLHPNVILTSAQNFEGPNYTLNDLNLEYWRIYAGEYNKATTDPHEQFYGISRVIIHPSYNATSLYCDVALIITSQPIIYNEHTKPACLSKPGHAFAVGEVCYVAGWGSTRGTGNEEILNQLQVQILDDTICEKEYQNFNRSSTWQICAGFQSQRKGLCADDVGSPLMCKDNNGIWYIQGLVSYPLDCKSAARPIVFQDVFKYSQWIQTTMAQAHHPYIFG